MNAEIRVLMTLTAVLLAVAAAIRVLVIPKFTLIPGRFQMALEQAVNGIDRLAGIAGGIRRGVGNLFRALKNLCAAVGAFCKARRKELCVWGGIAAALLIASALVPAREAHEDVKAAMRDAVLHDVNRVSLFGLKDVNPGLIAAMTVAGLLLLTALIIRLFVIPRFKVVPGRFQLLLEQLVDLLDGLAESRGKFTFIGAYIFAAGAYIFTGTLFELLGLQAVATNGNPLTLPAPLSDVNAAICMGCLSYLVIVGGGAFHAGAHGVKAALKEFSLPISMSFRLFGALLSGLLVTDLVYHYAALRYGVPVIVGVIFTLLHALVQTYVLTMLVGMYYGEVSEKPEPPESGPDRPFRKNSENGGTQT